MVADLICLVVVQQLSFGKFSSRAAFQKGFHSIKKDLSEDQVRALLGRPDEIKSSEQGKYLTWKFGTSGPGTVATLGSVYFKDGKTLYDESIGCDTAPPSPNLPPESVLRNAINVMWRPFNYRQQLNDGFFGFGDPLRIINATNALQPLGTEGAIAVIGEYCRVKEEFWDPWLNWLVRVLFVSKKPGYIFEPPSLGAYAIPKDLRQWPTFPVVTWDDIPITIFRGADLSGAPWMFDMRSISKDLEVRPNLLRPPDDPFSVYGVLNRKPEMDTYLLKEQLLRLVRNAYRLKPGEVLHYGGNEEPEFESYHQAFLKLHCRWDSSKNCYVRGDGTFNVDVFQDTDIFGH